MLRLFAGIAAGVGVLWLGLRLRSHWRPIPCPASLGWLLDNPLTRGHYRRILARLELRPGLAVLDAGCGPGLLTVPIARVVGRNGSVLAVDVQQDMIAKAKRAVDAASLTNVSYLVAPLGAGRLPKRVFDRALLVTVLGEIRDKPAALGEIYDSLRPGGFLSVTEMVLDPDYQSRNMVRALAEGVGFAVRQEFRSPITFTINFDKPLDAA